MSLHLESLDVEILCEGYLDVKTFSVKIFEMEKDHVDRFLGRLEGLEDVDYEVEGAVERIQGITWRLKRLMEETLADFDLTYGEWRLLSILRNGESPCTPGALATDLEVSSGAMTNRLDRMQDAGLIRRHRDLEDRRGIRVELTAKGRRVYEASTNAQARKEALVASALSRAELHQLNGLLRKLMLAFEAVVPKEKAKEREKAPARSR